MSSDRLSARGRAGILALAILLLAYGALTVARSAFLDPRRTDADVYFRAAWAIRSGVSPYRVTDPHGWHYHYPPLLAIMFAPFADPPAGELNPSDLWHLPYPVSVAVWYLLNLAVVISAVHLLARAIEDTATGIGIYDTARWGTRWWKLRLLPFLTCLPMIGFTLGRGQVNFILLLALCGSCAALLRGRDLRAGMWIALGACVKPYLLVFLFYPLWRRNWRFLAGLFAGLAVGLAVIPVSAVGLSRTIGLYHDFYELRAKGISTGSPHPDIIRELSTTSGDFPTYGTVLFKTFHRNPAGWPLELPEKYEWYQLVLGGFLVAVTLIASGTKRAGPEFSRLREVLLVGALAVAIVPAIPTCKPHYMSLATLLVMGLVASVWERAGEARLSRGWVVLFAVYVAANALALLPSLLPFAEMGAVPYAGLMLWAAGIVELRRIRHARC